MATGAVGLLLSGCARVPTDSAQRADGQDAGGSDVSREDVSREKDLVNTVAMFATPADAAAAVPAIADAAKPAVDARDAPSTMTITISANPVTIPRHPETRTWAHQETHADNTNSQVVQAFTAHGPYLPAQTAEAPSAEAAVGLIATTLDHQGPLIDGFVPTPGDQLAARPLDPTGLGARLLPAPQGKTVGTQGTRYLLLTAP